jgi:hypothetical protein
LKVQHFTSSLKLLKYNLLPIYIKKTKGMKTIFRQLDYYKKMYVVTNMIKWKELCGSQSKKSKTKRESKNLYLCKNNLEFMSN